MTRKEAMRFVRASDGNICIRYVAEPVTKRPIFADQLHQITRRTPGVAAGVMTASIALSAHAQTAPDPNSAWPVGGERTISRLVSPDKKPGDTRQPRSDGRVSLSGTVTDPMGAVIPNADVTLVGIATDTNLSIKSDGEGNYRFDSLQPGKYRLETSSPGFLASARDIDLRANADESISDPLEIGPLEATVEVKLEVALVESISGGMIAIVEYSSDLSRAIANDDVDGVRELLQQGVSVNTREPEYSKITPLFVAVENGNVDIVQMLLAYGAKPNLRDSDGSTALFRLDGDASAKLVGLLIRSGAKVNLVDKEGGTPLIRAARFAEAEVVQALIDAGADINHANNEGTTALMEAASSNELETVRTLLLAGARLNLKDKEGKTALDLADDGAVIELLLTYGATGKRRSEPPKVVEK